MAKLNKKTCDAAQPKASDYFMWDDELPGFGLRIFATGKKSYAIQYRQGGRTRRMAFAKYGVMTPEEARKHARELLVDVVKGGNPSEEKRVFSQAPTVAALCDKFLKEYVPAHCKPSTQAEYKRNIELFIKPAIGTHRVQDITRPDIKKLHEDYQHIPYQANRTLGVLSKLFNLSEEWGLRPDGSNPCRHVKKYPEEKRERYLTAEELQRLGQALRDAEENESESPYAIAAFRLLILTGSRLGEIQTLKWSYVREKDKQIDLPDSKTGAKKLYLSDAILDVLKAIPRQEGNDHVICSGAPGKYLNDLQHPWQRIRTAAKLPDVRIHDLRHSFASQAVGLGEGLPMIGKLLGHTQVQTTARYAHLADNPVQVAAEKVSGEIAKILLSHQSDAK